MSEHKHASVLAIVQLRHQSPTALSCATRAVRDSDVMFTSQVK